MLTYYIVISSKIKLSKLWQFFGGLLLFGPLTETRDLEVKSEPLAMHHELVVQLIKYKQNYGIFSVSANR